LPEGFILAFKRFLLLILEVFVLLGGLTLTLAAAVVADRWDGVKFNLHAAFLGHEEEKQSFYEVVKSAVVESVG
jgi:hypothetical protein